MPEPDGEPLFREIDHAADLAIEVEADSPHELFRRAGLALFALMVDPAGVEPHERRRERVETEGWDDLLHDWLARLLGFFLREGFIAAEISVDTIDSRCVEAEVRGERLDLSRHGFQTEIKAVTYHQLRVSRDGDRWRARVIFDV